MNKYIDVVKQEEPGYKASLENAAGFGATPLEAVRALLDESGPIKEAALEKYFNNEEE